MTDLLDTHVYNLIGDEGFERLTAAFYRRVATDDILAPMYPPDDMAGAQRRLKLFLVMRFGGPQDYMAERGHPRLRARHLPFLIDQTARDRWLELMDAALIETELPEQAVAPLRQFFHHAATHMINRGD